MQLIRNQDTPIKTRGINHRVGSFRYKELGEGEPGTPSNFNLRMVWSQTDFFSPRHRHNFDQVRVQMTGTFSFDDDGVMQPGVVGYFPEGALYGPQTSQDETCTLVLQIGGSSGNGYLSEAARIAAVEQLAKIGRFESGKYFAKDAAPDHGVDAFQAAWEHAYGRPMIYPPQRLPKPLLVDTQALDWTALPGASGVQRKRLWDFGAQAVGLDLYLLASGATWQMSGPATCFMQEGQGLVQAMPDAAEAAEAAQAASARSSPWQVERHDSIHLKVGESLVLSGATGTTILAFSHPLFPPAV